jgi:Fic family protein
MHINRYVMLNLILQRIEKKKKKIDKLRPFPQVILNHLKEFIAIEWTYNSNAIEGNSLTLRETQLVLQQGITIKGKSLREHFEAKNHEKAINYLENIVKTSCQLTETDVLDIHALVLDGIEEDFKRRYRNGQVRILGANFVPPNAFKVSVLMKELINWTNENPEKIDLVSLVSRVHHKFVWIHPFFDGNGRTGRLIMNLLLMKHGYPPAVILKNDRQKYYEALNQANKKKYNKLILVIAQAIERSLDIYLNAIKQESDEAYVLLSELAKKYSYSQEYLSLLARQGKIDAFKQNRNWLSTKKAIEEYMSFFVNRLANLKS